MNQRRLLTSSGNGATPPAILAGTVRPAAWATPSARPSTTSLRYSGSRGTLGFRSVSVGAVCVCVAAINMRSAGIPVRRLASSLASSSRSRGITHVSQVAMASRVRPSSSTNARTMSGSWAEVAWRSLKLPSMETGQRRGVTSTSPVPARSAPVRPLGRLP